MEFLDKLFPFESLFTIDSNTLTAWSVFIIIAVFLFYVFRLFTVTYILRKKLEQIVQNFSVNAIEKEKVFDSIWKDYQDSFIQFNDSKKTDDYSYEYFNEKNLLAANTNLKLINSMPGTLVGLGILGTFVGLTYGISNFQTESTEQIKGSIETLLSGMGTAFVSSIYGMFLSVLFTFIEKVQTHSLYNSIHDLCYTLDRKFRISKDDERNIQFERQEALLRSYFIYKDERGHEVKPGNIFRDFYEESRKQSAALLSFSTDLANLIEAGFEKILNDPDKGVVYELNELRNEIVNLGEKLQDPASEMTQNVVKDLEAALGKMMEEFKVTMSGSAKAELENLSNLLGQAGGSLTDFPNKLELMTDNLNKNFVELQEMVQQMTQQTQQQSEESVTKIRGEVEGIGSSFKNAFEEVQKGQGDLISQQAENMKITENLLFVFTESIEQLKNLTTEIEGSVSSFSTAKVGLQSASAQFENISKNVLTSTNSFKEAQNSFSDDLNDYQTSNHEITTEIQNSLSQAKELSEDYSQKFEIIEQGLQGIFGQIDKGLVDYRETVGNSLGEFLGKYTEALSETAKALNDTFSAQEAIVNELTEQLSKFQPTKI